MCAMLLSNYIAPGWDESLEKYITVYVYDNVIVSCS